MRAKHKNMAKFCIMILYLVVRDRQTDRQTDRDSQRQRDRDREIETDRERKIDTDKKTQTDRQTNCFCLNRNSDI